MNQATRSSRSTIPTWPIRGLDSGKTGVGVGVPPGSRKRERSSDPLAHFFFCQEFDV